MQDGCMYSEKSGVRDISLHLVVYLNHSGLFCVFDALYRKGQM